MQKLYFSISELSKTIDEEPHILRYWEKEFDCLKPKKNRGGNRVYSPRDVEIVKRLKILLREEKLSLKGAKEKIIALLPEIERQLNEMQQVKPSDNDTSFKDNSLSLFPDNVSKQYGMPKEELIGIRDLLLELRHLIISV
jgi:DNA-binding transcriptional MerR regulator